MKNRYRFIVGIILLVCSFFIKFEMIDLNFHGSYFLIDASLLIRIIAIAIGLSAIASGMIRMVKNRKSTNK